MRLGQAAMEALRAEITGCLKPGDELVVACPVALKGTSVIAKSKKDKLAERFSAGFIQNCIFLWDSYGAQREVESQTAANEQSDTHSDTQAGAQAGQSEKHSVVWKIAEEAGASALYAMGEGGFLSALWKMAEASEVGLEVDFRKVLIRQETIEVCEIFDLNPYKLQAEGSVLIGIRGGEALVQRLRNEGFMAEIIGQTNSGNDRLLYSGGSARYLERPAADEIYRILNC
ncbi:hydrogenase maturation factor [Ruminococcus sp. AF41-9]|mgnify:FL=1|nr:hydrogenase maturation factor [Ruminococcus sp. AF41-9]